MSLLQTYVKPSSFQSFSDFIITELGLRPHTPLRQAVRLGEIKSLKVLCEEQSATTDKGIINIVAVAIIIPQHCLLQTDFGLTSEVLEEP